MIQTKGEKIYAVFNYAILALISFATIYPFMYVLSASVSNPSEV